MTKVVKKRAASKKTVAKKAKPSTKKTTTKRPLKKTATKATPQAKAKPQQKVTKHVEGNPYRDGSFYATCFDCLAKMGSKKPVSRQKLLEAYAKASGKDVKLAKYDLAVVLSPSREGTGHRSSRKHAYYVERLNGLVRLHMAAKAE